MPSAEKPRTACQYKIFFRKNFGIHLFPLWEQILKLFWTVGGNDYNDVKTESESILVFSFPLTKPSEYPNPKLDETPFPFRWAFIHINGFPLIHLCRDRE